MTFRQPTSTPHANERGQMFMGYIIAIFILAALVVTVTNSMRRYRVSSQDQVYRELALSVAKAGFDDGLSYFRRQSDGVYLNAYSAYAPTTQNWVTPWPEYPDSAFLPQAKDTDNFNAISMTTVLNPAGTAGAIMRTITMNTYSNTATSVEMHATRLWGRYVLRRQNTRNWSPGSNTMAAFTDPDAAHDITHIRGQGIPGSGNVWSLVSNGYLFAYPNALTIPAAHEGNSLLGAPLRFYNGQRLLLARARVYGELSRINFNQPTSAVFVGQASKITVNTNGIINGTSAGAAIGRPSSDGSSPTNSGSITGNTTYTGTQAAPSLGFIFPGQTSTTLKAIAAKVPGKVGGMEVLPVFNPSNLSFNNQVSTTSFYYITCTVNLTGTGTGATVLSGVGLIIIQGDLIIAAKNPSSWAGVVVVLGNVDMRGPSEISGNLIATGTMSIGNSADINKTTIEYNVDAVNTVQSFLQNFQVLSSSIVTTQF